MKADLEIIPLSDDSLEAVTGGNEIKIEGRRNTITGEPGDDSVIISRDITHSITADFGHDTLFVK